MSIPLSPYLVPSMSIPLSLYLVPSISLSCSLYLLILFPLSPYLVPSISLSYLFMDVNVHCLFRVAQQFNMTCLGTIQTNRRGLPKHFTTTENREVGDYQVLYDEGSRISIHSLICKNKSGW